MGKIIVLSLAVVGLLFTVHGRVSAADNVCFCHNIAHNPITICTDNNGLINGHQGHVEAGNDTLGQCEAIPSVPEFSLATAGIATLLSGGVLMSLRNRLGL